MHSMFSWSIIRSVASLHLGRLNINVSSMLQIHGKILSILYFVSSNTRRHISLLQLSPLLFVRGEEKLFGQLFVWQGIKY